MKRVSILGSPGSGKTTFSKLLAKKTNLPLLHLDYYYHQKGKEYMTEKNAWVRKVQDLTAGESWILEGNYGSSYEHRLPKSDTIIFFDLSPAVSIYGVLKRRIVYRNKKRDEMPDDWKEKINPIFFKYVLLFKWKSRQDVINGIEKYKSKDCKVMHFTSRKDAYRWLEGL